MDELASSAEGSMVEGCRFCCPPEPWRIIWSTRNFNVQMGLGPLKEGYALVLSRSHYSCCAELPQSQAAEFEHITQTVRKAQINLYGESLMFEHGRSGACVPPGHGDDQCYHAHLHLLPATVNLADSIHADFTPAAFDDWAAVRDQYTLTGRPYVLAEQGGRIVYAETPDRIRSRYLRRIAANALGTPELEDWVAFPNYTIVKAGRDRMSLELNRLIEEARQDATAAGTKISAL